MGITREAPPYLGTSPPVRCSFGVGYKMIIQKGDNLRSSAEETIPSVSEHSRWEGSSLSTSQGQANTLLGAQRSKLG